MSSKESSGIKCRTVLWYLTFVGMAVNYMVRININMTIVTMVKQRVSSTTVLTSVDCLKRPELAPPDGEIRALIKSIKKTYLQQNSSSNEEPLNERRTFNKTVFGLEQPQKLPEIESQRISLERRLLRSFGTHSPPDGLEWNEYQQGLALGSFYWLHWMTQVPGGILAQKYGGKIVYGLSNFGASLLCFLMPIAAHWSLETLLFLRVLQGIVTGFAWPAMHTMTASWIPPNERSKFVTAYLGSSFGVFVSYPLFGWIISLSCWENVFHFCGIFGSAWYLAWVYCIFDSPKEHPRICEEERRYIEKSLGVVGKKQKYPTPWAAILTSKNVWLLVITQWGGIWGLFTLMTQAPTYLKYIHGLDMKVLGFLSGFPHLLRILFAMLISHIADFLLRSERMSRTNVRKLGTFICTVLMGLMVLGLAYSGCHSTVAITLLSLAVGLHGAVSTGALAALVDIAPNFAGITLGISGMIGVIPGFISPIVVGLLTLNNQTTKQWELVFLITGLMLIFCGIPYIFFGNSNLQSWNSPALKEEVQPEDTEQVHEKMPLREIEEVVPLDDIKDFVPLKPPPFLEPIFEDQQSLYDNLEDNFEKNKS